MSVNESVLLLLFIGTAALGAGLLYRWRRLERGGTAIGCAALVFLATATVTAILLLVLIGGASQISP